MTDVGPKPGVGAPASRVVLGLASKFRGRMSVLALVSFAGAALEAAFLVLLTTALLALTTRSETVGVPMAGISISLPTALATCAGAMVVRLVLALVGVRLSADLASNVTTDVRHRLAGAYLATSWSVQQAEASGRLQELLTSFVNRVNNAMTALTQGVTAALSLVGFLSMGVLVDPVATLAVIGGLGLLAAVLTPLRGRARRRSAAAARSNLEFASAVAELGALGQEMQTFGVHDQFRARIDGLTREAADAGRRVQVVSSSLSPVYTFLAYTAIVAGVASLGATGYDDLAGIGSVLLLMLRSLSYGQQLVNVSGQLAASRPFLERVNTTIAEYEVRRASNGPARPAHAAPIEARGLTYRYVADRPALHGLDFTIDRGEMVGVIGPSGSGKSTLAQILLGLRDPSSGVVTVDGMDLTSIDRSWWTGHMAFVPQDPQLLTGTVAENIRFFRTGITDEEVVVAAEQANIAGDVSRLPLQFDTHLGERGGMLSGGQRQRLAIARALVGRPNILVLDEPTSALDGESEALIRETLATLHGAITIVIIAHRMSSLDLCDRIMVLERGRITGFSAPETLRTTSGFYRQALRI